MKKIDRLLLTSFIGPFVVSFGIALFVLIMQFLWLYIDEIAGKGVSIFIMLELIGYLSVSTFPMALPIGVLIASVMVLGNLAERYELSSMKSAGVSLLRVMRPLMFVCAGVAVFSYVCSDFLIPVANLKFRSRLFDIRKQKPALSIEKGVFNDDFRQFIIRVGDKERDGETIHNVMIEDQSTTGRIKFNQILADSGQMYTTEDKRFFVMNLFRGAQYQEPTPGSNQKQKYPFVRTNFGSWQKVWDMREFEMNRTDEGRFKDQRSMLSIRQLQASIDSLNRAVYTGQQAIAEDLLLPLKRQPVKPQLATPPPPGSSGSPSQPAQQQPANVSKERMAALKVDPVTGVAASSTSGQSGSKSKKLREVVQRPATPTPPPVTALQPAQVLPPHIPKQDINKPLDQYGLFLETFKPEYHGRLIDDGTRQVKLVETNMESRRAQIASKSLEAVKTGYELYTKYSFALVCFLFLFIGAPMGAIIRKGGFGYPILISIIFFVIFVFLTILCRKLAETYVMTPFWAAMMPCLVLAPLAASLTRRATRDGTLFSTERLEQAFRWVAARFQKKNKTTASAQ